jgi:hypothetical protein
MDKDFIFEYQGKEHKLFDIITENDFMFSDETDDDVPNIILKSGIKKLRDFFEFKPIGYKILTLQDTSSWGTMMVIEVKFVRPSNKVINEDGKINEVESLENRSFVGDGEVNQINYSNKDICFPFAVAKKRAESRALTEELGIPAFGEEESESFGKAKRNRKKKGSFKPKSEPKPKSVTDVKSNDDEYEIAKKRLAEVKDIGAENGYERQALIGILRVSLKNKTGEEIKGVPKTEQFAKCPEAIDEAIRIINEGEWKN